MGRIVPMISYADAGAAIDWLCEAFGFREDESMRHADANGVVGHAELELNGDRIMVATPTPDYEGPRQHAEHCERASRWLDNPWAIDGVYVEVDDLDAHHARAAAAGARIIREPDDPFPGLRVYTAEDPEGHRWMFAQSLG
jgi:PhnB protein